MSYESEQLEYKKQLDIINSRIKELERLFEINPSARYNSYNTQNRLMRALDPKLSINEDRWRFILSQHGLYYGMNDSPEYMEYNLCMHLKKQLQYKLSESKTHRNIVNTASFVSDITPQHVRGRIYRINNVDSFLLFWITISIVGTLLMILFGVVKM